MRWRNDDYDRAFRASETELDPVKRAALMIRMNDLVCGAHVMIPLVYRPNVNAVSNKLHALQSGSGSGLWPLQDWFRQS